MQIQTDRLVLRDIRPDEPEILAKYFAEQSAQSFILKPQKNEERMRKLFELLVTYAKKVGWEHRRSLQLAVELKGTETAVGSCSATFVFGWFPAAMLGWHFGEKFAGNGYATEVASALIDYCFKIRGVDKVICDCFESNAANVRVLRKVGMTPSGPRRILRWLLAMKYGESNEIARYARRRQPASPPAISHRPNDLDKQI